MTVEELSVVVLELRREVAWLKEQVITPTPNQPRRFHPPTLEEVAQRMKQLNLTTFTPEAFHSYYESVGWMIGRNKMKSWTHALNTWANRNHTPSAMPRSNFIKFYTYNDICQMALTNDNVWREYVSLQLPDRPKPVWATVNDATTNDLMKYKV